MTVLFKRIENINIEEIEEVLPRFEPTDQESEYLKPFVTTTKVLFDSRATHLSAYKTHIDQLQQAATLANVASPSPSPPRRPRSISRVRTMHGEPLLT